MLLGPKAVPEAVAKTKVYKFLMRSREIFAKHGNHPAKDDLLRFVDKNRNATRLHPDKWLANVVFRGVDGQNSLLDLKRVIELVYQKLWRFKFDVLSGSFYGFDGVASGSVLRNKPFCWPRTECPQH